MPLDKSGSEESIGKNISAEIEAGKPRRQAVAIALAVQRRARGGWNKGNGGRISGLTLHKGK